MRNSALLAAIAGVIALGLVNASIMQKEALLEKGDVVYLELAPVDPRSLMQGDYMALRFRIGNEIRANLSRELTTRDVAGSPFESRNGTVVVAIDDKGVGRFARLDEDETLVDDERRLQFRVRNGRVKFATNAFFFQEGTAEVYAQARYGEFRVAEDGELLLTGLRDKNLIELAPDRED